MNRVTHVVVGFNAGLLEDLNALLPAGSVLLLEEPSVIESGRVVPAACVAAVCAAPIQDEAHPDRVLEWIARPPAVRAVVPAVECGVVAAAVLAESWGLPGSGRDAAVILRDKIRLRAAIEATGLAQPAWREVAGAADVAAFRQRHPGTCALKSACGRVRLIAPEDDPYEAWAQAAPGGRYLVEQRLRGSEVSVEALIADGVVSFVNVTGKLVRYGRRPVEAGHQVPGSVTEGQAAMLSGAVREIVRATGFRTGVLHSEWIMTADRGPALVECVARPPGDGITRLIDLAYGGNIVADLVALLGGQAPPVPRVPVRGAAIHYLSAEPGIVEEVAGLDEAVQVPGVEAVSVVVQPGSVVPVASSWDRSGHVIASGPDGWQAARRAAYTANLIKVVTR